MPNRHGKTIKPLHDNVKPDGHHQTRASHTAKKAAQHTTAEPDTHKASDEKEEKPAKNPAVDLIRRKLETLYDSEPNAKEEIKEVVAHPEQHRSKHQQFMQDLSTSGKSLAQIQTEWHNYYINLPDDEKHQVWQEFYSNNKPLEYRQPQNMAYQPVQQHVPTAIDPIAAATNMVVVSKQPAEAEKPKQPTLPKHKTDSRTANAIKKQIRKRVKIDSKKQAQAIQHAKSLLFGLGSGAIVLMIILFGLFNEMVIAPFIRPSSQASATPIILSTDGIAPSSTPEVIIPKISVQIPVDYSLRSNAEEEVQKGLENGIVHYPTTVKPGEKGSAAFFGHSSNNIFNPGKYKFAFVLLHELVPGDIFYLTYEGKVYSYKVFDKRIVSPSEVNVLNPIEGKAATAVLITCDPPGTALNRLVVWGEQVSPDPSGATDPAEKEPAGGELQAITSNGPSLWERITSWVTGE